ncbi:hypothetical protein FXF51_50095 [Nonomuraea sp. PA05]|uniref:hypothetical protein n=1 Tax=Nonomuraea sp. PA05 TaxID=2604466 RepID=UPI0011D5353F|nr:hypothetical protein [Nonomuraea sp. PA05]TYB52945.1 hypothetical protein FXF51_50095 [Nonomuraea sp. PA05]
MRFKTITTLAIASALTSALAPALTWPASAHTAPVHAAPVHAPSAHTAHDHSIRYASIKSCPVKGGGARPCGDWRLVMHDGSRTILPDAQGVAKEADGSPNRYVPAPVAVSGNGRRVAYFTEQGPLAVRTLGGGVKRLAADALPKVAQYEVTLLLSDDGARLAAVVGGDKPSGTRIFDTATGNLLGTLPPESSVLGFSGDGDELLATAEGAENVTDLVIHSGTGEELRRVTPPQVIAANVPQALAGDGRTVASLLSGSKAELVTYDSQGDQLAGRMRVKLPAGDVQMLDWTGDTQVTAHLASDVSGSTRMTIVQIDTATGTVRVRDRYTVLRDSFFFAACGG